VPASYKGQGVAVPPFEPTRRVFQRRLKSFNPYSTKCLEEASVLKNPQLAPRVSLAIPSNATELLIWVGNRLAQGYLLCPKLDFGHL
jgi:hypothetical protein